MTITIEIVRVLGSAQCIGCEMQEPEIEYIEGFDELEEEDDMEDFTGFGIDQSHAEDDVDDDDDEDDEGKQILPFYVRLALVKL